MRSYALVCFLFIVTISPAMFAADAPDPVYHSIRDAPIQETLVVKDLVLHRDVGTITLKSGTIGLAAPVQGRDTLVVFEGDGEFLLTPVETIERRYLESLTQIESVKEPFDHAMFVFRIRQAKRSGRSSRRAARMHTFPAF